MRQDVFGHIQKLPVNYFDTLPAGKIVARVTNDTEAVRNLYVTVLSNFAMSIVSVIGAYFMLFYWRRFSSRCVLDSSRSS